MVPPPPKERATPLPRLKDVLVENQIVTATSPVPFCYIVGQLFLPRRFCDDDKDEEAKVGKHHSNNKDKNTQVDVQASVPVV